SLPEVGPALSNACTTGIPPSNNVDKVLVNLAITDFSIMGPRMGNFSFTFSQRSCPVLLLKKRTMLAVITPMTPIHMYHLVRSEPDTLKMNWVIPGISADSGINP